jgi:UV DNA damage endonuclease
MVIKVKIRLGYVAISKTLENITSSSLMTFSHYTKIGNIKGDEKLNKIILSNFKDLESILEYNIKNNIYFYRMTSRLLPLLTHDDVDIDINKYQTNFVKIGRIIKQGKMRVDTHPDQFCVLNSQREEVVLSSINILKSHQNMFDLMKYDGKMILHVGSSAGGKKESIKRFKDNFNKLDEKLKKMILIENDDKVYNVANTLKLCEDIGVPMVLDYHHNYCNNTGKKIEDYLARVMNTWGSNTPKMHFSSPRSKKDKRAHHDYIDVDKFIEFIEKIKYLKQDIDIMLEAKMKDEALFRLIRQLKYKTNYKIIDTCIYLE